jgi:hypothetical protein
LAPLGPTHRPVSQCWALPHGSPSRPAVQPSGEQRPESQSASCAQREPAAPSTHVQPGAWATSGPSRQ